MMWYVNRTLRTFVSVVFSISIAWAVPGRTAVDYKQDKSDFNRDNIIDEMDLALFSSRKLGLDWTGIDWCAFREDTMQGETVFGVSSKPYLKHYQVLLEFIFAEFSCGTGPLDLINGPVFPARIASTAENGSFYVTDPKVGSVFYYDDQLELAAELKNLAVPLGVAIDSQGNLLVGSDDENKIGVYDPTDGTLLASFGENILQMPSAISTGPDGFIFVTDSKADCIQVFDAGFNPVDTIGSTGNLTGEFRFPVDIQIIADEMFVADQVNMRIQVFDLSGNYLRSINKGPCTRVECQPPVFQRLQALGVDTLGRLHALDMFEARVTIFDPASGAILGTYGDYGDSSGLLRLPTDLYIAGAGQSIITDAGNNKIEMLDTP